LPARSGPYRYPVAHGAISTTQFIRIASEIRHSLRETGYRRDAPEMLDSLNPSPASRCTSLGKENPESELARLLQEQRKARQDEIFGGFSQAERAEYNRKAGRINVLEREIQASAPVGQKRQTAEAEQKRQWNENPETDTHKSAAHQPYRSREKDSSDSQERSKTGKKAKGATANRK
jgi:hypothetical protein